MSAPLIFDVEERRDEANTFYHLLPIWFDALYDRYTPTNRFQMQKVLDVQEGRLQLALLSVERNDFTAPVRRKAFAAEAVSVSLHCL